MKIGGRTGIGMMNAEGTGTIIEGRIRIGVASGGNGMKLEEKEGGCQWPRIMIS